MKFIKYSLLGLVVFLLAACTKDFEEINTNPNAPVDVQPSLLLRKVLFDSVCKTVFIMDIMGVIPLPAANAT